MNEKFETEHSFGEIDIKEKRVRKFFETESLKFQKSIDNVSLKVEDLFKKLENKFGGMYNHLLRVFLVDLEKKTYSNEMSLEALFNICSAKMFTIEQKNGLIDGHTSYEEYKSHFNNAFESELERVIALKKKEEKNVEKVS